MTSAIANVKVKHDVGTVFENPAFDGLKDDGTHEKLPENSTVVPVGGEGVVPTTRRLSYVKMADSIPQPQVAKRRRSLEDVWDVTLDEEEADADLIPWEEKTTLLRVTSVSWVLVRILLAILCIYLFICSLTFLSAAFQLLGGKSAGAAFSQSSLVSNPIVGLMMGVLVTVLVQSSSTSTSIIVAMVAAKIVTIEPAIYLIMGANIGTTVTNTIVSMGQIIDRKQFRRAFAGATVHDCFNWLSVAVFLPLEFLFHPIGRLSSEIVKNIDTSPSGNKQDFIKLITKPFTDKVIRMNIKKVLASVTKYCTDTSEYYDEIDCDKWKETTLVKQCTDETLSIVKCGFIFSETGLSDANMGLILMVASLLMLCLCLMGLVKTLQSMLLGRVASSLKKYINNDLPFPFKWLTGYLFMVGGIFLTFLLQSSSVFTSTLTPLVGLGVISLDRMYPLTLGSNIGTTTTAMLAALASDSDARSITLQIAVCHLMFNIFGITLFYPIPFMRRIPLGGAKILGTVTANYRWFAIVYMLIVFLFIPLILLGLSFLNYIVFITFVILVVVLVLTIVGIKILQKYFPKVLPIKLQTWTFLPEPLRSLAPYDRILVMMFGRFKCCKCLNGNNTGDSGM